MKDNIIQMPKNETIFREVFKEILKNEDGIGHLAVVWQYKDGTVHDFWIAEDSSFFTLGMVDWLKTKIRDYINRGG